MACDAAAPKWHSDEELAWVPTLLPETLTNAPPSEEDASGSTTDISEGGKKVKGAAPTAVDVPSNESDSESASGS